MTNLCTLMTVIVGLAIAILACNGAEYPLFRTHLPERRQELIVKIEEFEKWLNEHFTVANLSMRDSRQNINDKIYAFQKEEWSKIDQQYISMEQIITKYIQLAQGKGSVENCTDNWEMELENLKNRTRANIIGCTLKIENKISRRFENITEDRRDVLNYLNEKKNRVEQCVKKYERKKSVTEHHFAKYCLDEVETTLPEFYKDATFWYGHNKAFLQSINIFFSWETDACFHENPLDKSLKEGMSFVNSTVNCLQDQIHDFHKNNKTFQLACSGTAC